MTTDTQLQEKLIEALEDFLATAALEELETKSQPRPHDLGFRVAVSLPGGKGHAVVTVKERVSSVNAWRIQHTGEPCIEFLQAGEFRTRTYALRKDGTFNWPTIRRALVEAAGEAERKFHAELLHREAVADIHESITSLRDKYPESVFSVGLPRISGDLTEPRIRLSATLDPAVAEEVLRVLEEAGIKEL